MIAMESLLRLGSRGRPVRPRWRSWGREAIDPHRLRPQRSGGRRGESFFPREECRAPARVPTQPAAWGGGGRGRKSRRRCGQAIGAQPAPPGQIRLSRGRTGGNAARVGRRRWRAAGGMIKVSPWHRGRRSGTLAAREQAWPEGTRCDEIGCDGNGGSSTAKSERSGAAVAIRSKQSGTPRAGCPVTL